MTMFRVSFFRKSEIQFGRAPRYVVDIEAESPIDATAMVKAVDNGNDDVQIRTVYTRPNKPISDKPSFVFKNAEARIAYYRASPSENKDKVSLCKDCHTHPAEWGNYCPTCQNKRENKVCEVCQTNPPISARRPLCVECLKARNYAKSKFQSELRAKVKTADRIRTQILQALTTLSNTVHLQCKQWRAYQGYRLPHTNTPPCRHCLQKFIDVQTKKLDAMRET